MATGINNQTQVEDEIKKTNKLRNIFGYTSNKFGRVILVSLSVYNNMLLNNDTLRDRNGLNDSFANLEGKEYDAVRKANRSANKKDITDLEGKELELAKKSNKEIDKDKEIANKIIAKKVSTLKNFMDKYEEGVIPAKKTGLIDSILDLLSRDTAPVVDNSKELKAKDTIISDKDKIIAKLEADLVEAQKTPEVADKKVTKEAPVTDADGEDSPFDK